MKLEYAAQPTPNGLAQAFVIGADFVRGHPSCLILGDNIIHGHGLSDVLRSASERKDGATIFGYWVDDPQRYGVIEFDDTDARAVDRGKAEAAEIELGRDRPLLLRRERRGARQAAQALGARRIRDHRPQQSLRPARAAFRSSGSAAAIAWLDAGTYDSLLEAAEFIRVLQRRQGQLIAAPEEIAFRNGWISPDQLKAQASKFSKTHYGARLLDNLAVLNLVPRGFSRGEQLAAARTARL